MELFYRQRSARMQLASTAREALYGDGLCGDGRLRPSRQAQRGEHHHGSR